MRKFVLVILFYSNSAVFALRFTPKVQYAVPLWRKERIRDCQVHLPSWSWSEHSMVYIGTSAQTVLQSALSDTIKVTT